MDNQLKTLRIQFQQPITMAQVPAFRGGIIATMEQANTLFHNHLPNDSLRYRYPLVQYKRIGGKAAIVCVGDGTEAVGDFFANCNFDILLGTTAVHLEVERIRADKTLVQVWDTSFEYTLRKWLPLNQDNYDSFKKLDGIVERCAMLEKLLVGNILSFAKGVGITIEKEITVKIKTMENEHWYSHKGTKVLGYDIEFSSNVSLPSFIGLGKGVSLGFGMVKGIERKGENEILKLQ